jgi:hypothetical protein
MLLTIAMLQNLDFFFDSTNFNGCDCVKKGVENDDDRDREENVNRFHSFFALYPTILQADFRFVLRANHVCWINQENKQKNDSRHSESVDAEQEEEFAFVFSVFDLRSVGGKLVELQSVYLRVDSLESQPNFNAHDVQPEERNQESGISKIADEETQAVSVVVDSQLGSDLCCSQAWIQENQAENVEHHWFSMKIPKLWKASVD